MMSIYHEKQEAALCGQHCLNNLLQGPYFDVGALADIAHELDAKERAVMMSEGTETADAIRFAAADSINIDESGNFSITVLRAAVRRSHSLELIATSDVVAAAMEDPTKHEAFVLNLSSHWYTVRKIGDTWFNLNSLLLRPETITPLYLSVFLAAMRAEGYSIFVVEGTLPAPMREGSFGSPTRWHALSTVIGAGPAPRMVASPSPESPDAALAAALRASLADAPAPAATGGSTEDEDLALAMALSMTAAQAGGVASPTSPLLAGVAAPRSPASPGAVVIAPNAALLAALPPEPAAGLAAVARIQVRLPSGAPIIRRFAPTDALTLLFQWVHAASGMPGFKLVSTTPRLTVERPAAPTADKRVADLPFAPSISLTAVPL